MGRKNESSALMIDKKLRIVKNIHQADLIIFPYLSVFFRSWGHMVHRETIQEAEEETETVKDMAVSQSR